MSLKNIALPAPFCTSFDEEFSWLDEAVRSSSRPWEEREAELAEEIASALESPAWSKKVTEPLSKKVTKRVRRTDKKSKQVTKTLRFLESVKAAGGSLSVGNPSATLSPPSTVTLSPPSTVTLSPPSTISPSPALSVTPAHKLPVWEHIGDRAKLTVANQILAETGGVAFSLNLSDREIALAHKHPKGFSDYFKRKADRWMERYLGGRRWYWFAVDVTDAGRLHLHGAIEFPIQELDYLGAILRMVGGDDWKPSRRGETQIHFEQLRAPDGWVTYCLRNKGEVKRLIKGKLFTLCQPLTVLAKLRYQHVRNGNIFYAV